MRTRTAVLLALVPASVYCLISSNTHKEPHPFIHIASLHLKKHFLLSTFPLSLSFYSTSSEIVSR